MTPREQAVDQITRMVDTYPTITPALAVAAVMTDLGARYKRGEVDEADYLDAVVGVGETVTARWGR